jgi:acyl carrier protein
MSWREPVFDGIRRIVPGAREIRIDDSLSLLDDLGLSSRQLVELASHIDRVAKRRVPTEEWFVDELSGEQTRIGSLIRWLDTNHPRS